MNRLLTLSTLSIAIFTISCGGGSGGQSGKSPTAPSFDTKLLEGTWLRKQMTVTEPLSNKPLVLNADQTGQIDQVQSFNGNLGYSLWYFTVSDMKLSGLGATSTPIKVEGKVVKSASEAGRAPFGEVESIDGKSLVFIDSSGRQTFEKVSSDEITRLRASQKSWYSEKNNAISYRLYNSGYTKQTVVLKDASDETTYIGCRNYKNGGIKLVAVGTMSQTSLLTPKILLRIPGKNEEGAIGENVVTRDDLQGLSSIDVGGSSPTFGTSQFAFTYYQDTEAESKCRYNIKAVGHKLSGQFKCDNLRTVVSNLSGLTKNAEIEGEFICSTEESK